MERHLRNIANYWRLDGPWVMDDLISLMPTYLINAKNYYYRFAVCPGFWDGIVKHHQAGAIYSIDRVQQEILRGDDDLTGWAQNRAPAAFFLPTRDALVEEAYDEIMRWVDSNPQFYDDAKKKFAPGADGWLVAYAKCHDCIVVTKEKDSPEVKKRVPLPNVCTEFGVATRNVFEMLQDLNVQFILK